MKIDEKKLPLSIAIAAATWTLVSVLIDFGMGSLGLSPAISGMLIRIGEYPLLAWLLVMAYEAISMFVTAYLTALVFVKVYSRSNRK